MPPTPDLFGSSMHGEPDVTEPDSDADDMFGEPADAMSMIDENQDAKADPVFEADARELWPEWEPGDYVKLQRLIDSRLGQGMPEV